MHLASIGPGIGWGLKTALPYADPAEHVTPGPVESNPPPPS